MEEAMEARGGEPWYADARDAIETELKGDVYGLDTTFEDDRVVAVAGVNGRPRFVGEVAGLLRRAMRDEVDVAAVPPEPDRHQLFLCALSRRRAGAQ